MHPGEQSPDELLAAEARGQQVMVEGLLQGDQGWGPNPGRVEAEGIRRRKMVQRPRRSRRWSPTRRALAMAVREGLTAPIVGMKLVSTT